MKNRLINALSRLASSSYQEAFMVSGTKDEYVVPEDLVEDVASLCRLSQRAEFAAEFEPSQMEAVVATLAVIGQHGRRLFANPAATTAAYLVREDQDWAAMRSSASECLGKFGIDAAALRSDEIDRNS